MEDTRVDVTIGDESPDDTASNHRKERPIWMTESTIINSDGSQVFLSFYHVVSLRILVLIRECLVA